MNNVVFSNYYSWVAVTRPSEIDDLRFSPPWYICVYIAGGYRSDHLNFHQSRSQRRLANKPFENSLFIETKNEALACKQGHKQVCEGERSIYHWD